MTNKKYDVVIVGQGIAGTSLAWALHLSRRRVAILDENASVTSSKIAAGLITPITGKRLVLSRDYEKFFSCAKSFYSHIEDLTGRRLFYNRTARRFLQTEEEIDIWHRRQKDPAYIPYIQTQSIDEGCGFEMEAAQLDVGAYLSSLEGAVDVVHKKINWEDELSFHQDHVSIAEYKASFVISCEGEQARHNPYFTPVRFNPAKGDILRVKFETPVPENTFHERVWMAPTGENNIFFVGSTYDWDNLNSEPTRAAREDIEARLGLFMKPKFDIIDHKAAVRPIIFQSLARIGTHPDFPRLGFFNGLGSKGSLQAPWYAKKLVNYLFEGESVNPESDVASFWK